MSSEIGPTPGLQILTSSWLESHQGFESLNETEVEELFLSSCRMAAVGNSTEFLAEHINESFVDYRTNNPSEELAAWRIRLDSMKKSILEFSDEDTQTLCERDEVFLKIFQSIIQTKEQATRHESLSARRRALIHLFDFRLGTTKVDKENEVDKETARRIDTNWNKIIDKLLE